MENLWLKLYYIKKKVDFFLILTCNLLKAMATVISVDFSMATSEHPSWATKRHKSRSSLRAWIFSGRFISVPLQTDSFKKNDEFKT